MKKIVTLMLLTSIYTTYGVNPYTRDKLLSAMAAEARKRRENAQRERQDSFGGLRSENSVPKQSTCSKLIRSPITGIIVGCTMYGVLNYFQS